MCLGLGRDLEVGLGTLRFRVRNSVSVKDMARCRVREKVRVKVRARFRVKVRFKELV